MIQISMFTFSSQLPFAARGSYHVQTLIPRDSMLNVEC